MGASGRSSRPSGRRTAAARARATAAAGCLLALVVGAGAGLALPTAPSDSLEAVTFTPQVPAGGRVVLTLRAQGGARDGRPPCTATWGRVGTKPFARLPARRVAAGGLVTWSWVVPAATAPGRHRVFVGCGASQQLGLSFRVVPATAAATPPVHWIERVTDGDTIRLRDGRLVRLAQVDAPEGAECYGRRAASVAQRLLPPGARVRLRLDEATDRVDARGRLVRHVVRVRDGANIGLRLTAVGAAVPYFHARARGRHAARLEKLALEARERRLGLWGACPRTPYDPYGAIAARR